MNKVINDIKRLQGRENTQVIITTRSMNIRKRLDYPLVVKTCLLEENRVKKHLESLGISFDSQRANPDADNDPLLDILRLPYMLTLYAAVFAGREYAKEATGYEVKNNSDVFEMGMKYHKNKPYNPKFIEYVLDILMPRLSQKVSMLDIPQQTMIDLTFTEVKATLTSSFHKLWSKYDRDEIKRLSEDDDATCFNLLIWRTLIEEGIFLIADSDNVIFRHQLVLDWFKAQCIALMRDVDPEDGKKRIDALSKDLESELLAENLLPTAQLLYEILEKRGFAHTEEFLRLLASITVAYDNAKDSVRICEFAELTLAKLNDEANQDLFSGNRRWERADIRNHTAYALLHTKAIEKIRPDFDYRTTIKYAKAHLDLALNEIQTFLSDNPELSEQNKNALRVKAQIHGNLGAYCLAQRSIEKTEEAKKKRAEAALDIHREGLKVRELLFEKYPDEKGKDALIGTSYNCLATDHFYLDEFKLSLEYHKKAIGHREKAEPRGIHLVESYIRCAGTLNQLMKRTKDANDDFTEYRQAAKEIYEKVTSDEFLYCLRINRSELLNLKNAWAETKQLVEARGVDGFEEDMEQIESMMTKLPE
jgi:hypothetical protein